MSLMNCPRCGKVYQPVMGGRELCPSCIKQEEEDYKLVFQFMTSRPSATAQEIANETGVELKEILRFVRENRLHLVKADQALRCESCGTPISSGKICDNCRKKLTNSMKKDIDNLKREKQKSTEKYSISRDKQTGNISRKKKT